MCGYENRKNLQKKFADDYMIIQEQRKQQAKNENYPDRYSINKTSKKIQWKILSSQKFIN